MKAVIATTKCPTDFDAYIEAIKELAVEKNVVVRGYIVVYGHGCFNHGIILDGEEIEEFLNHLTMALMPARWSTVSDDDPGVLEGQFELQAV
jgi:hypothetical protein